MGLNTQTFRREHVHSTKTNMKTYICVLAFLGTIIVNTIALSVSAEKPTDRFLLCNNAEAACTQSCSGRPCGSSCYARCGFFGYRRLTFQCSAVASSTCLSSDVVTVPNDEGVILTG